MRNVFRTEKRRNDALRVRQIRKNLKVIAALGHQAVLGGWHLTCLIYITSGLCTVSQKTAGSRHAEISLESKEDFMGSRINVSALLVITLWLFAGCATHSRTVRTETTYEPARYSASDSRPVSTTAETRTTTETNTESEQQGGLVSGTVDIVGKTIALPFRVVGGLVDLIF
jgi:hypothetical protein